MKKIVLASLATFLFTVTTFSQVSNPLPPSYRTSNNKQLYRAEADKVNDLVHTKIKLSFDFDKEEALGEEWVTLTPHFYDTDSLTLDAKAMLIHEVSIVNNKYKKPLTFDYDSLQIKINLDKTYHKDENYTIYINYTARPNHVKQKGSQAITSAKGLYFIDPHDEDPEKPTQIWTQGETESSSCWFPTIDKPNQKTSEELYLTVPNQFVTLSNGLLQKQTKNSDGTRTDYWNFKKKHAPYLFFFGVGDYAIVKDSWQGKPVNYYVEPDYAIYAKQIFGDTPEMIQFYSDVLDYPYPWSKYSQIVGRDYVSGAMENTTAVLHQESAQQKPGQLIDGNAWEGVIAHELFHHWFGDLVTTESWSNLTVNESMANYSEYLWWEHKEGKEKADEDRYNDLMGYERRPDNFNKDLVRYHYTDKEKMFDGVTYNKGGKGILHMLRSYLGDKAFFGGLSKYLHDNEYGTGEVSKLRLALEAVSGRDLNWFFNQWYYGNGHPRLDIQYNYDATAQKQQVTVMQKKPFFEFPMAFDIVSNGQTMRHNVWVSKDSINTFEFTSKTKPKVVIPNANQDILCDIVDNKPIDAFIAQYKAGKGEYITRRLAIDVIAAAQTENTDALNTLIDALTDSYDGIRSYTISKLDLDNNQVKSKAVPVLKKLASSDPKTLVQAAAIEALEAADIQDQELYRNALKSKSYSVQGAAASALINMESADYERLSKLDDDVLKASPDLVAHLIPYWSKTNDVSKVKIVAKQSALYSLMKFRNPELGAKLEPGFKWSMAIDDLASTKEVAAYFKQIRGYIKSNPIALNILKSTVQEAISLKKQTLQSMPSKSLDEQIKILNEVLESM